jgi:uncharacterized membrane protein|tara:strand:- start:835 stop:2145 length:1311 start_codon:yes stop_codon:yes gene_type:complete
MRLIRLLKNDLAKETATWVDKDLISLDQARSICSEYDVDYDSSESYSAGYRLLVALGYLFIGLAVITLLGANWDEIPRGVRMAGLMAITLGTHSLGFRSYLIGNESSAIGFFLLGNLFYGASIILIAQIYHLGEYMPDGVFWWALGSLPFGVLLRNSWLTLFSCLLAIIWFFLEYKMDFFPTLFPLFIAAGLFVLIKGQPSILLFLTVVASIGLWVEISLSAAWAFDRFSPKFLPENFLVTVALFIFAYALSQWLHARDSVKAKDYGTLLSLWSLRFGLITMLVLSFHKPWDDLIHSDWNHQASMWQIIMLLMGLSLWLGWKTKHLKTLVPIIVFSMLSMVALVVPGHMDNMIYFQITYNVALISAGIWLIHRGIQRGISHYFFLGTATILLTALMRYIDLIGEYIGGAILFMGLAALLLGAAKYWKTQSIKVGNS